MKLGCDLNLIVTARLFEKDYVLMFWAETAQNESFMKNFYMEFLFF